MSSSGQRIAVLACMDARLDASGYLDGWPEPVHIARNAGGRATPDVLRSLGVSCTTGIDRILVFHHTRCAMAENSEADLRGRLPEGAGPEMDLLTIDDQWEALRADVEAIRRSPLIPSGVEVSGFIYDLDARRALGAGPAPNVP